MLRHLGTGAPEKQLGIAAQAPAADHDQVRFGLVGHFEQYRHRRAVSKLGPVADPGAGQRRAPDRLEQLLNLSQVGLGGHGDGLRIHPLEQAQSVNGHHLGACVPGLPSRPFHGHLAVARTVHSHDDDAHRRLSLPAGARTLGLRALLEEAVGSHSAVVLVDNGLELLTEEECRALLGTESVGRIAVSVGALPGIFPVNYVVVDDDIVFLTGEGLKLRAALENTVVGFEVDSLDRALDYGWSVLVVGVAREVSAEEQERLGPVRVSPWAGGDRTHMVRIHPEMISGRRIVPPAGGPG
jgi:uncharacterized protein